MKKLVIALSAIAAISSTSAFANGGKIPPPLNSAKSVIVIENGGKIPPPTSFGYIGDTARNGGKIPPPHAFGGNQSLDNGGKIPPPSSNIVAQDSGAFSLSDIFSQYFSF